MMVLEDVYEAYRAEPYFKTSGLRAKRSVLLRGRGSPTPAVLVVGPYPAALDTAEGKVFAGLPGVCLESLMSLAGLRTYWAGKQTGVKVPPGCAEGIPGNAFITHLVKYRADGGRAPTLPELLKSKEYLRKEYQSLGGPRVIVVLGQTVWSVMGPPATGQLVWNVGKVNYMPGGVLMYGMYHPNYGIKHAEMQEKMEQHWTELGEALREEGIV